MHFQDLNAETIRCTTIPNVLANLEQARDRQSRQTESPLTPSRQTVTQSVHFYAGDWEELPTVLSIVRNDGEASTGMNLSFSEEDFMDGCSSQDGSILARESSSRRSRKLSGSRAWERASETEQGGGYDIILLTEIPYSLTSLKKLYALIKKVSFFAPFYILREDIEATYLLWILPSFCKNKLFTLFTFALKWSVFEAPIWSAVLGYKKELRWLQQRSSASQKPGRWRRHFRSPSSEGDGW